MICWNSFDPCYLSTFAGLVLSQSSPGSTGNHVPGCRPTLCSAWANGGSPLWNWGPGCPRGIQTIDNILLIEEILHQMENIRLWNTENIWWDFNGTNHHQLVQDFFHPQYVPMVKLHEIQGVWTSQHRLFPLNIAIWVITPDSPLPSAGWCWICIPSINMSGLLVVGFRCF